MSYKSKHTGAQVDEAIGKVLSGDVRMTLITYKDLVELRNAGTLEIGMQYRITDYVTTTKQNNTKSADHQFDIIVTADDVNVLNEKARAIHHEGDTYFENSDLNAWEIWYCLDNDTDRFIWCDSENGKGVIYRMIDEFKNDCPYDFKNIMFKRWKLNAPENKDSYSKPYLKQLSINIQNTFRSTLSYIWSGINDNNYKKYWMAMESEVYSDTTEESNYFYTFSHISSNIVTDKSLNTHGKFCYENVIKKYKNGLNNNVFFNTSLASSCYANYLDNDSSDNSFGNFFSDNTFGISCNTNTFGNYCDNNTFGNKCYANTFGHSCTSNIFGNYCDSNSFNNGSKNNTFGNYCYSNAFDTYCEYIFFGNKCYTNTLGYSCNYNYLGNKCYANTFGNFCVSNSFGNNCDNNSFGNSCNYNSLSNDCKHNCLGNNCISNSFGNGCIYIQFGTWENIKSNYKNIIVDNDNKYIYLNCTKTTGSSTYYQNVRIGLGVNNTIGYITIDDSNSNQNSQTLYLPANSQTVLI